MRLYEQIRVAVFLDGMSRREASRKFGAHRDTVNKALSNAVPRVQYAHRQMQIKGFIDKIVICAGT